MPAYYTHYTCGLLNYRELKKGYLKECIKAAQHAYCIGLAGPDIFFYSIFDTLLSPVTAGSILHVKRSGEFLQNLFMETQKLKGHAKVIAIAYLAGFVGHYELDCACHPLIYSKMDGEHGKRAMGQHFTYEAAVDVYCVRDYLGRKMNDMNPSVFTALSKQEKRVIAMIVTNAFQKTFPKERLTLLNMEQVLSFYKLVTMLIIDRTGCKERLLLRIEEAVFHAPYASPLFINDNLYHVTEKDWQEFKVCFENGKKEFKKILPSLEMALLNRAAHDNFYQALGNKSYHTGQELSGD